MPYFDPTPKPEHRCSLPSPGYAAERGWRCDCGKAYVLETLSERDTNPGELPYQWRRSPEHDIDRTTP